jgi:hypothetical protein
VKENNVFEPPGEEEKRVTGLRSGFLVDVFAG